MIRLDDQNAGYVYSTNTETLAEETKSLDNNIRKLLPKV